MRDLEASKNGLGPDRIGEVIESASRQFAAQCYRLYEAPPLGAIVRTGGSHLPEGSREGTSTEPFTYAVVYDVSTQALDPGRPVIARGEEESTEADVYRSNPQLARLLCTRFEALILGHGDGDGFNHYLPPLPPRIHAFVYSCPSKEVTRFSRSLDFLPLMVNSVPGGQGVTDEVIAACLRRASSDMEDGTAFLVRAGKSLSVQLLGDLPRLNSILRRLSP